MVRRRLATPPIYEKAPPGLFILPNVTGVPLVPRGGTPVTFLNTSPHPNGLREGVVYVADPYPGCNCAP